MRCLLLRPQATWFSEQIRQRCVALGVDVDVVEECRQLRVGMATDADGAVHTLSLSRAGRPPADAVVNLGLPSIEEDGAAARFEANEWTAAVWASLARFEGPVWNRPTPQALVPALEAHRRLPARVRGVAFRYRALGSPTSKGRVASVRPDEQRNVYDEWSGRLLMRMTGESSAAVPAGRGVRTVDYDPCRVRRYLIVGDAVLSTDGVRPPSSAVDWLREVGTDSLTSVVAEGERLLGCRVPTDPPDVGVALPSVIRALVPTLRDEHPVGRIA